MADAEDYAEAMGLPLAEARARIEGQAVRLATYAAAEAQLARVVRDARGPTRWDAEGARIRSRVQAAVSARLRARCAVAHGVQVAAYARALGVTLDEVQARMAAW